MISDCIAMAEIGEGARAIRVFERIINKTFDYTGSASYNLKRINMTEEYMHEMPSVSEFRKESELGNVGRHPTGLFGSRTDPTASFRNEPIQQIDSPPDLGNAE